jgi:A nuclease family of the HNH/ENDO VII superfamily with conserved AHH
VIRQRLSFRAVNRQGDPDHQPDLQRHHLLPRQALRRRCFGLLFDSLGPARIGFDDFRRNGMLLPASERAAMRIGLPLHRGPHRSYNELVIERIGQIEAGWRRRGNSDAAIHEALARLALLQRALRRRLLADRREQALLNRRDPAVGAAQFAALDALADELWGTTEPEPGQPVELPVAMAA